ncbi:hypothetical protein HJG54_02455 [Leptolyngbya sp. NK1-12]|uniref:Uncharacterized protein n=1 Tax=Leptolyngbya sp. NK1-12 TaxID=2547451 RepID=A0AA97AEB4_9CYAN|nr:hypothetical protein [Leptolyngbya sp. NK1-12]WNZ21840.1 hypothetical protein HJG54_02455 [Leptolyngbya sp. NK1-12]
MVSNQTQSDEKQRQAAIDGFIGGTNQQFNFDVWAVAVKRQMLAALKKRESNRVNWD